MLAFKELLHSKLKFGLIALAIGLVVSLTMLMSAMSEGLVTGMTGAKGAIAGDALVFQADTEMTLERSLLSAADLERVRTAAGVRVAIPVGHAMATLERPAGKVDVRVLGLADGWEQLPIVAGRGGPLGPGEAVLDESAQADGVSLEETVRLGPAGSEVTIVGFTSDRRYVMLPVLYVDMPTWEQAYVASTLGADAGGPGAPAVPASFSGSATLAAVDLAAGTTVADLAEALGPGFEVATPAQAAGAGNGMPVMILAVNGMQVFSLVLGALIIGIFFYITTLHKTGQMAAVKALGASNGYLYRQLLLQIALLVTLAVIIGMILALGAGASMPPTMAFDFQAGRWAVMLVAVYVMAFVGSLFSLRSILAIDPATALDRGEH